MPRQEGGTAPALYHSRGFKIQKSIQHKEMFSITDLKTQQAHSITTSDDVMMGMYPVEKVIRW